mmetsp:Transcript_9139/g.36856  ORF Transcript_9139/g.36856 Transcript_9139/m.36856 type:complete len:223 (+) Transcript_9139:214-882(+)
MPLLHRRQRLVGRNHRVEVPPRPSVSHADGRGALQRVGAEHGEEHEEEEREVEGRHGKQPEDGHRRAGVPLGGSRDEHEERAQDPGSAQECRGHHGRGERRHENGQDADPHVRRDDRQQKVAEDPDATPLLFPRAAQPVQHERHDERVYEPGDVRDGRHQPPQLALADDIVRGGHEQIIDAEYRVQQANYPGARHEMPGDQRGGEKPLAEHISIRGHFGTAP